MPPDFSHLLKIVIDQKYRGQSLGEKLLCHDIHYFKQNSYESIYLEVAVDNEVAKHLYQKAGFSEVAYKSQFYSNGKDACAMQLKLD